MLGDGEDQGGAAGGSALGGGGGGGKSEEGYRSSIFLPVLRIRIRDPVLFCTPGTWDPLWGKSGSGFRNKLTYLGYVVEGVEDPR